MWKQHRKLVNDYMSCFTKYRNSYILYSTVCISFFTSFRINELLNEVLLQWLFPCIINIIEYNIIQNNNAIIVAIHFFSKCVYLYIACCNGSIKHIELLFRNIINLCFPGIVYIISLNKINILLNKNSDYLKYLHKW